MSLYNSNSNQVKLENPHHKSADLKIRTSLLQQQQQQQQSPTVVFNQYYPSPHSPLSTSTSEQALSQSMLQEQQQQQEEWIMMQNQFDEFQQQQQHQLKQQQQQQQQNPHMHHYQHAETSFSEASSLGIRTPDIGLSDIISTTTSTPGSQQQQQQIFGYTSFLHHPTSSLDLSYQPPQQQNSSLLHHQCQSESPNNYLPSDDWIVQDHIQLIPSLSHQDHMMLLQKGYSEETAQFLANQQSHPYDFNHPDETLTQLSREQLIERVVQLEMEKSNRSITIQHEPTLNYESTLNYKPTLCKPTKKPTNQQPPVSTTTIKQEEPENKMYSCLWVNCTAQAPSLDKLMTHICESHIGSGKATYFCEWEECPRNKKPFMKRHKMHNHMRTHTGERPFVCTVIGCNKTFSRPDSLSTHIKTHSDIRPYLCSMPGCEKAYFHSRSLRKHIKSSHMKKPSTSTTSVRRNTPSSVQQQSRKSSNNTMSGASRNNNLLSTIKLDHPYSKKQIIIPSNHSLHHQFYSM